MSILVIDIETLPIQPTEELEKLLEHKLRNLSTAEEKEARRTHLRFLDPTYAQICAIAVLNETDAGEVREKVFTNEEGEEVLLQQFAAFIHSYTGTFVHFNGLGFDVPFIMAKCGQYGIELSQRFCNLTRFRTNPHYDIFAVYGCWGVFKPSLAEVCYSFGIPSPKDILQGKPVVEFLKTATIEEIQEYCMGDVRATHELYKRISAIYR